MRSEFIFLFLLSLQVNCLKFLIYNPKSTRSHVICMNKIADVLVDAGHDVTIYMPDMGKNFGSDLNHKKARIIERPLGFEPQVSVARLGLKNEWEMPESFAASWSTIKSLFRHFVRSCDYQLRDEELFKQLRNETFDLGITELFDLCGLGVFENIGLKKHIIFHSNAMDIFSGLVGVPGMPSLNPSIFVPEAPPISLWTRIKAQLVQTFLAPHIYQIMLEPFNTAFERNGLNVTFYDLTGRTSYWFINMDELVNFPTPISNKIIDIAGLGLEKTVKNSGKLTKKLQSIFDNAKVGVVYVSFGSVAKSAKMPPRIKQSFVDAFKEFPEIDFIWKYETPNDGTVEKLPNVHMEPWVPQNDILAQKKLLAFMTQSGINSITEASYFGIPLVCIPLFTDQPRNALMVKYRKTAVVVNKHNITKDSLVHAFRSIIYDKSYYNNAKELARMIAEKPMKVDERVLKYSEFAAKFDVANQLDIPGRTMSTIQFYNLDVIFFIAACIFLTCYVIYRIVYFIVRKIYEKLRKQSKKRKSD